MASADCFVSVVAPLRDDADIVDDFVTDLSEVLRAHYQNYEIVLVDDGSADATAERVAELLSRVGSLRLIRLSRRFGREVAITAGLESVIGDYIAVMLPDSDPPDLIPAMVETARRSGCTVLGVRRGRRAGGLFEALGAKVFHWYCGRFLGLHIPPNSSHFRVLSRQAVNAVIRIKDRSRHIRAFTAFVGYAAREFPYDPISRRGRAERRSLSESVELGVGIIVSYSRHPLRLVARFGLVLGVLSTGHAAYLALAGLLSGAHPAGGLASSLQLSLMFGFLFLILAVLCEYVGRMLGELQDRPLYYLLEERSSPAVIVDEERENVVTKSTPG